MKERIDALRSLLSPLTAFFCGAMLCAGAGAMLSSVLSVRLNAAAVSVNYSGLVLALFYAGYVFAATRAHKMINRVGHIRSFGVYISVVSCLSLMHGFGVNPIAWAALRFLEGYCMGGCTMCLESWLNARAHNKNRGLIMSLYMVTSYLGSAGGQLMLNIPDANGMVVFVVTSIAFSLAFIPISLTALPAPEISIRKNMSVRALFKKSPVGIMGLLCSGFMVGSFYLIGPLWTQKAGLSIYETSMFMFFGVLGGMCIQIPLGRLSDRMDRRLVMLAMSAAMFLAAPLAHMLVGSGGPLLAAAAFAMGACTFFLYPICVSHINDLIDDSERVGASGVLIMMQGLGLILGPIIVSQAMEAFGNIAFAASFSAAAGIFALYTVRQLRKKPDIAYLSNTPTDPIPAAPTAMFNELAAEDSLADRLKKSAARKRLRPGKRA